MMKALDKYSGSSISALGNRRVNEVSHIISPPHLYSESRFVIYFRTSRWFPFNNRDFSGFFFIQGVQKILQHLNVSRKLRTVSDKSYKALHSNVNVTINSIVETV